ncbi:MAG: glycosyltransferase family 2 protein [Chloroflexi bacterium]|nr:glycosyltransferase family 2 protein [Chloroflexota bacterium]
MSRMENIPTVSVVMPTHNRGHIVGRAIQSVLDQTYRDFEFIIVNDGSRDNTEEVVKKFKDERIRYIRLEKNSGTCAVPRNTGIRIARGKYIAHQDDDTLWHSEKLEKQVRVFDTAPPEIGIVYTGFVVLTDSKTFYLPPRHISLREGSIYGQVIRNEGFSTNPNVLTRKECFEQVGLFDERLPSSLDWDMWIRITKRYQVRLIDEPLATTYYSPDTSHFTKIASVKARLAVLNKHFDDFMETNKELLAKGYFELGLNLYLEGHHEGRGYPWRAFRIFPRMRYGLGSVAILLGLSVPYNHALVSWDAQFVRLEPLIGRLRPVLGWAYPFLSKFSQIFFLR